MNERRQRHQGMDSNTGRTNIRRTGQIPDDNRSAARWLVRLVAASVAGILLFLLGLSLGSGWTFPRLLPDRLDAGPWRHGLVDGSGLIWSVVTSIILSLTTAVVSTGTGFMLARSLRHISSVVVLFLVFVPFVISPVIAGSCLYDLAIRIHVAGTFPGVLLVHSLFATSFATNYFRGAFGVRTEKLENLVRTLGGSRLDVWRHAVWPQSRGLVGFCLIQTALYSWLDYGLVSVIGGGKVVPVTVRLFAYIREASTNQAALASMLLMLPAIAGLIWASVSGRTPLSAASVALDHSPSTFARGDHVSAGNAATQDRREWKA